MRGVVLIVTAALALLTATTALPHAKHDVARPTVRITQVSPLVVAGERFRPVERIAIQVTTPERTLARTMRTTRRGTFIARFAAVTFHRCDGGIPVVVTTAVGVMAKVRMPQALCPPRLSPLGGPMQRQLPG